LNMDFQVTALIWMGCVALLLVLGTYSTRSNPKLALGWYTAAGLALAIFTIQLDPFLHLWDERFHALVAKNMVNHPFHPRLFATTAVDSFHDVTWDKTQTWLHKQPFFLWLMAGSIRLFGAEVWAVRLPAALLWVTAALALLFTLRRMAQPLAGWMAFLFTMTSGYWAGLVGGYIQLDQNDATFASLVVLSMAAWVHFTQKPNRTRAWLVGACAGAALLTKWLPGGLVFGGWLLYAITEVPPSDRRKHFALMAQALAIALVIVLPWQVYTLIQFPTEFAEEWHYNARHLWEPIEGHDGPWWYQLNQSRLIWGPVLLTLLALSLLVQRKHPIPLFKPMALMSLVPLVIYSLAATKMPSFMVVAWFPVCWLASTTGAHFIQKIAVRWPAIQKPWWAMAAVLVLFGFNFKPATLIQNHRREDPANIPTHGLWSNRQYWVELAQMPQGVVFNVPERMYVDCMFYTPHLAYPLWPDANLVRRLLESNQRVYILLGPQQVPPLELQSIAEIRWLAAPPFNYG
jgi:4-amino-4-deoxy-L-arabinose transferase